MKPLVLLSNDDGWSAPGLQLLRGEVARFADVVVCAPQQNQSATSHALTLHRVLRLRRVEEHAWSVDGTPADCIYVALHSGTRVLPRAPDMVVSGMNNGPNLGIDVVYSGTVAAAREAAHRGIPAVTVSADALADKPAAAALAARIVAAALARWRRDEGSAPLLNVNVPAGERWELRATTLGRRLYQDEVIYRNDPRGLEYLWIGGSDAKHERRDGTDTDAYESGLASVTPLTLDLTAHDHQPLAGDVVAAARAALT